LGWGFQALRDASSNAGADMQGREIGRRAWRATGAGRRDVAVTVVAAPAGVSGMDAGGTLKAGRHARERAWIGRREGGGRHGGVCCQLPDPRARPGFAAMLKPLRVDDRR